MKLVDNPALTECHFSNGMPMLPYYHCGIVSKLNGHTYASETMTYLPFWKRLVNLVKSWRKLRIREKDILIFSSTLFNIKKGRGYYNYLHGYYYDLYSNNTLLIEDGDANFEWRTWDTVAQFSSINSSLIVFASLMAQVCHKIRPHYHNDFKFFEDEYPSLITKRQMSQDDYFVKFYSILLNWLYSRVKPKCVILNCASYGHNMAVVTYCAKKRGIKVIEPQHGVTFECPAYMASDIISNSTEYYKCLPDVLFAFGEYWLKFVNWKYEKYIVGSAYLNEYALKAKPDIQECDFLIISQPMFGQQELDKIFFVKKVAEHFGDKKITFRIHPSENYNEQKGIFKDLNNITVSESTTPLFDAINNARYIVGWYSNCLYEALAFGKNPIIVDTPNTREWMAQNIGVWVKEPSEMTEDCLNKQSQIDYTLYWADDFQFKVRNYIDRLL